MSARNKARKRAFQILFEADQRKVDLAVVLADWTRRDEPPVSAYTKQLVEGYLEHSGRIDDLLGTYAMGWTLDRMPSVDRSVLRIGTYELLWEDEVPDPVVLDEAVELVKEFSTDESPGFVNGLLGRLQELKPSLAR